MLSDFIRTAARAEEQKISEGELRTAAALLRAKQFIWQDKRGESRSFEVIRSLPDYFKNLFDAFDDELEINTNYGYIGIIPRTSFTKLPSLETYFLLILAKMHDGEMRKGASDFGRTTPPAELLIMEYESITGQQKPNETRTTQALRRLSKFGVIRLGQVTEHNKMPLITIMPSIIAVVSKTMLSQMDEMIAGGSFENSGTEFSRNEDEATYPETMIEEEDLL